MDSIRALFRYSNLKRAFDVAVSATVLLLLWPVCAITALVILLSMGRPVLFAQERPGLRGELFRIYKFRTMRPGRESDGERLTRPGRLIRSLSLDELPQLWNVLKGDMSLVGPRPLLPEYLPLYSAHHARRQQVRPGITGLAQVSGRNALAWNERLDLDAKYTASASSATDLWILKETIRVTCRRTGVNAQGQATVSRYTGS